MLAKTFRHPFILFVAVFLGSQAVPAQTTQFTYQGKLTDGGNLANGNYDLQFKLFDTATVGTGTQQGSTVTVSNVSVSNGIFTVPLDFGACPTCFNGAARFLEIAVRPTVTGSFTTLTPRQPIASNPYAIRSLNAANATTADGLSVACVNCVTSSHIASVNGSAVTGTIPVASVPAGSGNYIQNGTSPQASSNFNISGNGTAGGILSGNVVNTAAQFNLGGQRVLSAPGTNNLFAGINVGTTGNQNAFFGSQTGQGNTTGTRNAFFGSQAGLANTTGSFNAFFGFLAGGFNTIGSSNAFFGEFAGFSNTTGANNVFFGEETGFSNTSGSSNTFIGRLADFDMANPTGSNNTLLGANSRVFTNFSNATAIGAFAQVEQGNSLVLGAINGVNTATADTKVGIGTTAPDALLDVQRDGSTIPETARFTTFGATNEILSRASGGTRAAPTATTNGRIMLQLGATGHDGTSFVLNPKASILMTATENWTSTAQGTLMRFNTTASGTTSATTKMIILDDGSVGIGTTAPTAKLTVSGDGAFNVAGAARFDLVNTTFGSGYLQHVTDSGLWQLATTAGTTRVVLDAAGNVGIGTTAPLDKLDVNGDVRVGTGTTGCVKDSDGTVIAGTACSSDARLKRDITPFPHLLDKLVQLQPVHFFWRNEEFKERHFGSSKSFGLIAQEVEKVLPELVSEDAQGYKAVNYSKLPLLSIQAIKELKAENDALKDEIVTLKKKVEQVEALKRLVCKSNPDEEICKP